MYKNAYNWTILASVAMKVGVHTTGHKHNKCVNNSLRLLYSSELSMKSASKKERRQVNEKSFDLKEGI